MKLTGRTRMRVAKKWFNDHMLVIQVEEEYSHAENFGSYIDVERRTRWRDARVTDIKTDCSLTEVKS